MAIILQEQLESCYNKIRENGGFMTKEEVLSWAKENNHLITFDDIEFAGTIDKNDVYAFTTKSGEVLDVGLPRFIVVENNHPRIAFGEEAFKVIRQLSEKDYRNYTSSDI
jgi:hypothetical protein